MDDTLAKAIEQHVAEARADERAIVIDILQQTLNALKMKEGEAVLKTQAAASKRGRKPKAMAANTMDPNEVESAVLNGLRRWSEPQRPNCGELAKFIGVEARLVSKAIARLEDSNRVNHTGERRASRYFIPIAAARQINGAPAEA